VVLVVGVVGPVPVVVHDERVVVARLLHFSLLH
jgi:hypothetical protein